MLDVCKASLGHSVNDRELVLLMGALVSVRPRQQRVTEFISPETDVIFVRSEFQSSPTRTSRLRKTFRPICGCPSLVVQDLRFAVAVKASTRRGLNVRIA